MLRPTLFVLTLACLAAQPARATAQEEAPAAQDWRLWTEQLAPSYISEDGRGPRRAAVEPLLHFVLTEGGSAAIEQDERARLAVFERLAPNLEAEHCGWILEGLRSDLITDPDTARRLLLAAPFSESGPTLLRLALDEDRDVVVRAEAITRLLAAEGRVALESLQSLVKPETEALLLRRIYAGWARMVTEDDLPRLAELVRTGPGLVREFALQTWARVETRAEQRVEILKLSEHSSSAFRGALFRELAVQGPDPAVADYVRSMLDSTRPEDRRIALASLINFAPPDVLIEEWKARRLPNDALSTEGMWMAQLARLSLDEAQREVVAWLVDRGYQESRYGLAVAQSVAQHGVIDEVLGSFLRDSKVPQLLRAQLAADRAAHSEEARAWLRRVAPTATGIMGVRMIRALGTLGQGEDLLLLNEIASDPGRPGLLRAEAVRALRRVPGGVDTLARLVAEPPADYETAEAVVETAALAEDHALRMAVREAVADGFGRGADQPVEAEALWRTLWRAQLRQPQPAEASDLLTQASRALLALPDEDPTEPWPDPRALRGDYLGLLEVVQALAATAPARAFRAPKERPEGGRVSRLGLLVWAEACLVHSPDASVSIAGRLAADPGVLRGNRMRALGLAARAARRAGYHDAELAVLERVLELLRSDLDEADLVDLAYGLGLSSPRAWLLPLDEVGQRMVLAQARSLPAGRGGALAPLLEGGCQLSVLLEAGDLLAESESWSAGLRFARRAADFEPGNVRARWQLGRAYEAIELYAEAQDAYEHAVRLGPSDPATAQLAASRLAALQSR